MSRNPKQLANLKPPSTKEARERGRKGGKASARSRAAMKDLKEILLDEITERDQREMLRVLIRNARRGHLPSLEFLLKIIGQHPSQGGSFESGETGIIIIHAAPEEIKEYGQ